MAQNAAACGRAGERIASAWLEMIGFRIIGRNRRAGRGEIDIVALDRDCLVFVEVKTRRSDRFGPGVSAVDRRKIRSMRRTAARILASGGEGAGASEFRFDVVALDLDADRCGMRIRHLRGVC